MKKNIDNIWKRVKFTVHLAIITILIYNLIRRALMSIPQDWLFFFTSDAIENILCATIAYTLYYQTFKLNNNWNKAVVVILFSIALFLLALLKEYRIHEVLSFDGSTGYITSFIGIALLFYILIYFTDRLEYLTGNRHKKLEMELEKAKEQLLRQQFNPHFLFNAFNSLYSMSLKNHSDTSDAILKLSSIMRYVTDMTSLDKVKLTQELDFIEKYIAIEKIRFGENSNIRFKIEGDPSLQLIEPFLLMTLVENAFKHGFYTNSKDAFVHIHAIVEERKILLTVENHIPEQSKSQVPNRKGKGWDNLTKRLALLYPKKSSLALKQTDHVYHAKLIIDQNP